MLYREEDYVRECSPYGNVGGASEPYRSPFRRDYARIIHSPAFRRLQNKTQLFPGIESDFFRNRLTHSLEVAQIAKSIAIKLNYEHSELNDNEINLDLVETAALCHDLGHPPFGHNGEAALDSCMRDFGGFEGNAQTLRILAKLEKKEAPNEIPLDNYGNDTRVGLNFTHRTLAAVLKYDSIIPIKNEERGDKKNKLMKGYYTSEKDLIQKVKKNVCGGMVPQGEFKTLECQIMDIADDIAYSTYDFEDALKAEFLNPLDLFIADDELLTSICTYVSERIGEKYENSDIIKILTSLFIDEGLFKLESYDIDVKNLDLTNINEIAILVSAIYRSSLNMCKRGHLRSTLTSDLVGQFIRGVEFEYNHNTPCLSKVKLSKDVLEKVETLKKFTFESLIKSPRLSLSEYRGEDIVKFIFEALSDEKRKGYQLLPDDFKSLFLSCDSEIIRNRVICDYIAGMTDNYAIEFYGRLKSENPQTIFKPL